MAARIPVKAIYSGSDVTSLGEFTSSDTIAGSYLTDGSVTAAKLAADTATQAELDVVSGVANAALPKAGGTMTGNLVMGTNLVDGIDISARDAILTSTTTTAGAALPKAGGTMTGNTLHGDDVKAIFGDSSDLQIYHGSGQSYISDTGTGDLRIRSNGTGVNIQSNSGENMGTFTKDGAVTLYHDNSAKIATTANGITVTGTAVASTNTDATNTGSVTLDFAANQNFVLTLTGNVTLANPTTETVGQSGFIACIQDSTGSRTLSLGTDYETAAGAGITLTSTASATDLVPYLVVAANRILLGTPQLAFA